MARIIDPTEATEITNTIYGAPVSGGDGKTLSDMRSELSLLLGSRDDLSTEQLNGWINRGYRHIPLAIRLDLSGSLRFTLIVDQPLYLLPTGVRLVEWVHYHPTGGYRFDPLINITEERWTETINLYESDLPRWFTVQRGVLALAPPPCDPGEISLRFEIDPQPLTEDSHQTILGSEWDSLVVKKALQYAREDLGEPELASVTSTEFLAELRSRRDRAAEQRWASVRSGIRPVRSPNDLRRFR